MGEKETKRIINKRAIIRCAYNATHYPYDTLPTSVTQHEFDNLTFLMKRNTANNIA